MTQKEFEALLKPDRYQVFLFACPASMPFSVACHTWFVINKKGVVERWEVGWGMHSRARSWSHLDLDVFPPHQGVQLISFVHFFFWRARLVTSIEGDEGSVAARMTEFITRSPDLYFYRHHYSLMGPNSNTYTQWVLNHFPEAHMQLPWNSLGKAKVASVPLLSLK